MRIVMFSEYYLPFINGVITHIETLKQQLEQKGHEVLIVTAKTKRSDEEKDGEDVMRCTAIPLKKLYGYGITNPINVAVYLKIRDFAPDLIHVHTEFSIGLMGIHTARLLKVPLVYTLHTMYNEYLFYVAPKKFEKLLKPVAHFYLKNVALKATEITGPSPKVVDLLRESGVNKHVNIIRNSMNKKDFFPENNDKKKVAETRKKLGIADDETALIYVGRLGGEKSIDELIDCFDFACADLPKYKLIIVGHGPQAEELKSHAASKSTADRIQFTGKVPHNEIQYYYLACDLFSGCSTSETNSISMLEGMAAGLFAVQKLDIYDPHQIMRGVAGELFESKEGFRDIIIEYDALSPKERKDLRHKVTMSSRVYDEKAFCEQVLFVYERAVRRYRQKRKSSMFFN